jgi:short-subunit dehydrogenase
MSAVEGRPVALVTGASSGIGEAFARRLSGDGYAVVAVARRRQRLEALVAEGSAAEVLVADLATESGCRLAEDRVRAGDVSLLVNNAGVGVGAAFEQTELDAEERMLALNVRAVMRLTHLALPAMLAAGRGEIVNVSSMAGFTPAVGYASYSATKAYVTALSESLGVRYAPRGVRVMALCAGLVRTEMHEPGSAPTSGLVARLMWSDPEQLVDRALRDLRRGKVVCVPGGAYKASVAALRFTPRLVLARAGRIANRGDE